MFNRLFVLQMRLFYESIHFESFLDSQGPKIPNVSNQLSEKKHTVPEYSQSYILCCDIINFFND